jgi:hypothetical protein
MVTLAVIGVVGLVAAALLPGKTVPATTARPPRQEPENR